MVINFNRRNCLGALSLKLSMVHIQRTYFKDVMKKYSKSSYCQHKKLSPPKLMNPTFFGICTIRDRPGGPFPCINPTTPTNPTFQPNQRPKRIPLRFS